MASVIDTIKSKVELVDEIGLVVVLQKSGKALKGLCPFHNERTPSFYVFPETQTWRCFGCNEGGDLFSFVQKQQGLDFKDALAYLAEKAGVKLEEHGNHDPEGERERNALKERLLKLNEEAQLWFHQALLRSREAAGAREYVQSRGVSSDTVIAFGLGYAPDQWSNLSRYLLSRGYTWRELVMGGVAREREHIASGESSKGIEDSEVPIYDYFRNRIIFPIRDMRGRVIGFGGRAMGDGKPKYLNSPQTALFEKNSVLYAIDMARDAIKSAKQVVIVEGYVDAVIAHQYGTKQTVACIGSAITERHIQQLKKLTKQVTLALDPDAAGSAATEHGIQEALKTFDRTVIPVPLSRSKMERTERNRRTEPGKQQSRGMIRLEEQVDAEINVLRLPAGEDPDEFIRRDFSAWLYAVAHPLSLMDYYFEVKTADLNLREPGDRAEAAERLLPVIGMVTNRVKRDAYVRRLASMIRVDERSLLEDLRSMLRQQPGSGVVAQFSEPLGRATGRPQNGQDGQNKQDEQKREPEWLAEPSGQSGKSPKVPEVRLDRRKNDKIQWEDYLIGLLLQNPELSPHICGIITDGDFAGTDTRELYRILNSMYQRSSSPSHQPVEQMVPSTLLPTVMRAQQCVESKVQKDGNALVDEALKCAFRLRRVRLLQLNTELQYLLQDAESAGDTAAKRSLYLKIMSNRLEIKTIDSTVDLQG